MSRDLRDFAMTDQELSTAYEYLQEYYNRKENAKTVWEIIRKLFEEIMAQRARLRDWQETAKDSAQALDEFLRNQEKELKGK